MRVYKEHKRKGNYIMTDGISKIIIPAYKKKGGYIRDVIRLRYQMLLSINSLYETLTRS